MSICEHAITCALLHMCAGRNSRYVLDCNTQVRQRCGLDPQLLPAVQLRSCGATAGLGTVSLSNVQAPCMQLPEPLETPVFAADSQNAACTPLVRMQSLQQAAAHAYQHAHPLGDAAHTELCNAEGIMQRLFGQFVEQLHVPSPPVCNMLPEHSQCSSSGTACMLLSVPLMPPQGSAASVRRRSAGQLLDSCQAVDIIQLPEPDLAAGRSFGQLMSHVQVLRDAFMTLPEVVFDDQGGHATQTGSSGHAAWLDMLLKARNIAPSQLLLDWCLADAAAPDPSMRIPAARRKLRGFLQPQPLLDQGQPAQAQPLPWAGLVGLHYRAAGTQQQPWWRATREGSAPGCCASAPCSNAACSQRHSGSGGC